MWFPTKKEYSYDKFCEELSNYSKKKLKPDPLRMFVYLTKISNIDDIIDSLQKVGFSSKKLGEILEVSGAYNSQGNEIKVKYFVYFYKEKGLLIFFTESTAKDSFSTLNKLNRVKNIYELWIPPKQFNELKDFMLLKPKCEITEFSSERIPSIDRISCRLRPDVQRKIKYRGIDGKKAIEEFKYFYGVLPIAMTFWIPDMIKFKITNQCVITFVDGDLNLITSEILDAIVAILFDNLIKPLESSKLELIKEDGIGEIGIKQLNIVLNSPLDFEDYPKFLEVLEDNSFFVYNESVKEGSLLFSAHIMDSQKGNIISLTTDGKQFSVVPKYDATFDSLYRFYRTVVENLDPLATCGNA